ncbi:hypothetical protein KVT40_009261 [Elsinoe batatas]|uniref:PD-(D/E)XK nuclease-like domain-containing protein n=1 Tax=Elsinoe batatas TaxID=2601811 RepID=A0A8K0KUE8_9PEZI|nr:hypothetical protein KVT40_009261 [Elsinoe batatas]
MPYIDFVQSWIDDTKRARSPDREDYEDDHPRPPSKKRRRRSAIAHQPDPRGCSSQRRADSAMEMAVDDPEHTPTQTTKKRRGRNRAGSQGETQSTSPSKKSKSITSDHTATSSSSAIKAVRYQDLPEPMESCTLQLRKVSERYGVRKMFEEMEEFIDGHDLVGQVLLNDIKSQSPSERMFQRPYVMCQAQSTRRRLGLDPTLREVNVIVAQAQHCSKQEAPETAWNTDVQTLCLNMAVGLSTHSDKVASVNVTTAKANERFKIRTGEPVTVFSKVVDFVILLRASKKLAANRRKLFPEHNWIRDYNHLQYALTSSGPISVSIETKIEGEGQSTGRRQLMVAAAMQFKRLESILSSLTSAEKEKLGDSIHLPWLPMLFVQGPIWYYLVAERTEDHKTILHEKSMIGDVKTIGGVLKVTGAVLLLLEWSVQKYQPWLEKVMDHLTEEKVDSLFSPRQNTEDMSGVSNDQSS